MNRDPDAIGENDPPSIVLDYYDVLASGDWLTALSCWRLRGDIEHNEDGTKKGVIMAAICRVCYHVVRDASAPPPVRCGKCKCPDHETGSAADQKRAFGAPRVSVVSGQYDEILRRAVGV